LDTLRSKIHLTSIQVDQEEPLEKEFEAYFKLQEHLEIFKESVGKGQLKLYIMNRSSRVYVPIQGRIRDAEAQFLKLLEVRRRDLGEEHVLTLKVLDMLESNYIEQGGFCLKERCWWSCSVPCKE
jgi:hypothetical protein